MHRFLLAASLVGGLMVPGTARADYLLIKVNADPVGAQIQAPMGNQGGFGMAGGIPGGGIPGGGIPGGGIPGRGPASGPASGDVPGIPGGNGRPGGNFGGIPGGFNGMGGGGPSGPAMMQGGQFGLQGGPNAPADADKHEPGEWLYVYVEVRGAHGGNGYINFAHPWGKKGGLLFIPKVLTFDLVRAKTATKQFSEEYKKQVTEVKGKSTADALIKLARFALAHSLLKEFHVAMGDLSKIDPKNDPAAKQAEPFVKNYQRLLKALKEPATGDDPAQKGLLDELRADGFHSYVSEPGHFALWTKFKQGANTDALVKHKLGRLEANLECFYYWFAMQPGADQPALPKMRLVAVMTEPSEYQNRQVSWGVAAPVADGFTPRRDNVLFLASRRQDPLYTKLEAHLKPMADKFMEEFSRRGVTRENLLNGKVWDDKRLAASMTQLIYQAETMLIVQKALEDDSERATISHDGTRQLLVASGIFPRHVDVPEWVLAGLASYFETPAQGVYPGIGIPNWTHLVSFKHFLLKDKTGKLANSADVLYNVVTDRYFHQARQASELAQENREDEKLADRAREDWELARCTAWAYIYYLASNGRINDLVKYGHELNQLPRDLELNEQTLAACAARAFGLSDVNNAGRIDLTGRAKEQAAAWFGSIRDLTLELPVVENYHLAQREEQSRPRPAPPPPAANGPQGAIPGTFPPNPGRPMSR